MAYAKKGKWRPHGLEGTNQKKQTDPESRNAPRWPGANEVFFVLFKTILRFFLNFSLFPRALDEHLILPTKNRKGPTMFHNVPH